MLLPTTDRTFRVQYEELVVGWFEERRPLSSLHVTIRSTLQSAVLRNCERTEQDFTKQPHQFPFPLSHWEERPVNEKRLFPASFPMSRSSALNRGLKMLIKEQRISPCNDDADAVSAIIWEVSPLVQETFPENSALPVLWSNKCITTKFVASVRCGGIYLSYSLLSIWNICRLQRI